MEYGFSKKRIDIGKTVFVFMLAVFCAGELTGALLYCGNSAELPESLKLISGSFFSGRAESTFIMTVINSFSGAFLLLSVCFLLGFGVVFQPVAAVVPFFRGIGIGITLAEINGEYGVKGFALSLAVAVPYAVASGIIIAAGAKESVLMSVSMAKAVFGDSRNKGLDFKLYFTKFVMLAGLLAAAAAADGLLSFMFAGLWTRIRGM